MSNTNVQKMCLRINGDEGQKLEIVFKKNLFQKEEVNVRFSVYWGDGKIALSCSLECFKRLIGNFENSPKLNGHFSWGNDLAHILLVVNTNGK